MGNPESRNQKSERRHIVRWISRDVEGGMGRDSCCYAERPQKRKDGIWCPSGDNGAVSCGRILEYLGVEDDFPSGSLAKVIIEMIETPNQGSEPARQGVGPADSDN